MPAAKAICIYFQEKLIPGIFIHWRKYQEKLIETVKQHGDIVVAGDGRHDSMGHSAKYCAYTVFCCSVPFIIHFSIVQVWCTPKQFLAIIVL